MDEDITHSPVETVTVIHDFQNSELHVTKVIKEYGFTTYGNNLIDICVEDDICDDTVIPPVVWPNANLVSVRI